MMNLLSINDYFLLKNDDIYAKVANELDPSGKFRNEWARAKIFGEIAEIDYETYLLRPVYLAK